MNLGAIYGCHQMPSRSFFIKDYQFPLCARCFGVLIGELISFVTIFLVKINIFDCLLFLIPMGIDWVLQEYCNIESNNIRRLITGIMGGFGLIYMYFNIGIFIFSLFE